jgi:hypothetical protein
MAGSLQKHNSSFSPKVASAMPNHCAAWVSVEANASQTHLRMCARRSHHPEIPLLPLGLQRD